VTRKAGWRSWFEANRPISPGPLDRIQIICGEHASKWNLRRW